MTRLIAIVLFALSAALHADGEKFEKLVLKDGREFVGVTVTKKTADGVSIMHESGTAKIGFERLPDDVVTKLGGFDADAAKEERKKLATIEAKAEKAEQAAVQAFKNPPPKPKLALIKVMNADGTGDALCYVLWVKKEPGGDMWVYGSFDEINFIKGIGDVTDNQILSAALLPAKNHTYTTVLGSESTVKGWTISGKIGDGKGIRREGGAYRAPVSSMRRIGGG